MVQATERAGSLELIAAPTIEKRIFVVRGRQVMLDEDLADLYGAETRVLIQQVKRNVKRFPEDFMFQLKSAETEALRSQIVISNEGRGGRRYDPYVFTEQGIAMLSGVLRSDRATAVTSRSCVPSSSFAGLRVPMPRSRRDSKRSSGSWAGMTSSYTRSSRRCGN